MKQARYKYLNSRGFWENLRYLTSRNFDNNRVENALLSIQKSNSSNLFNELKSDIMSILLRDHIMNVDSPSDDNLMFFINHGADINFFVEGDRHNSNLLMIAAAIGQINTVKFLISLGADTHGTNQRKQGIIGIANKTIKDELKQILKKHKNLKKLELI